MNLFAGGDPATDAVDEPPVERLALDETSWLDVGRCWLAGADALFAALVDTVPWRQGRRRMWDRVLDDPRLSRWYAADADLPHPTLGVVREQLSARYRVPFGSIGLNFYRDGRDSVAFHAARELRELDDTLVAIVTLGGARPFLVRPKAGGRSVDVHPASGDLLVMGGRCQLAHEHGVPKVARAYPRISVSLRWSAGRPDPGAPEDVTVP